MTPEQTLDWLAEQHKSQCNEDRPVQKWIRSMKSMLPAPVQEPHELLCVCGATWCIYADGGEELMDTPPAAQRQWVGLTAGERDALFTKHYQWDDYGKAIEAKLREKNA